MKHSLKVIKLIKQFEGLRLKAYKCPGGVWTIGYGCTSSVTPEMQITETQAETMLIDEIEDLENDIISLVSCELTENELCALVSLVFNIGLNAFRNSSLLKKLNNADKKGASDEFLKWCYVNSKVCMGLLRRRQFESQWFLSS